MKNFTKHNWVKAVAMVVIAAFLCADITRAAGGDFKGMHLRKQQGYHEVKEESLQETLIEPKKAAKQSSRWKIGETDRYVKWPIAALLVLGISGAFLYKWVSPFFNSVPYEEDIRRRSDIEFVENMEIKVKGIAIEGAFGISENEREKIASEVIAVAVKKKLKEDKALLRFVVDSNMKRLSVHIKDIAEYLDVDASESASSVYQYFADGVVMYIRDQMNSRGKVAEKHNSILPILFFFGLASNVNAGEITSGAAAKFVSNPLVEVAGLTILSIAIVNIAFMIARRIINRDTESRDFISVTRGNEEYYTGELIENFFVANIQHEEEFTIKELGVKLKYGEYAVDIDVIKTFIDGMVSKGRVKEVEAGIYKRAADAVYVANSGINTIRIFSIFGLEAGGIVLFLGLPLIGFLFYAISHLLINLNMGSDAILQPWFIKSVFVGMGMFGLGYIGEKFFDKKHLKAMSRLNQQKRREKERWIEEGWVPGSVYKEKMRWIKTLSILAVFGLTGGAFNQSQAQILSVPNERPGIEVKSDGQLRKHLKKLRLEIRKTEAALSNIKNKIERKLNENQTRENWRISPAWRDVQGVKGISYGVDGEIIVDLDIDPAKSNVGGMSGSIYLDVTGWNLKGKEITVEADIPKEYVIRDGQFSNGISVGLLGGDSVRDWDKELGGTTTLWGLRKGKNQISFTVKEEAIENKQFLIITFNAANKAFQGKISVKVKLPVSKEKSVKEDKEETYRKLTKEEEKRLIDSYIRRARQVHGTGEEFNKGKLDLSAIPQARYEVGQKLTYLNRQGEEWEKVQIEVVGVNSDGELTALLVDKTVSMKRFSWNLTRVPGRQDIYEVVEISTEYNRTSFRPADMAVRIKNGVVRIIMDYSELDAELKHSKRFLSPEYDVPLNKRGYDFYSKLKKELDRLSKLDLLAIDTEHTKDSEVVTISLVDGGVYKEWRYRVPEDLFVRETSVDDLGNVGILVRKGGADDIIRGELIVGSGDSLQIRDIFGERHSVDDILYNLTPNQTPRTNPLPEEAALQPAHQLKEAGRSIASQKVSHPQPVPQLAHSI